MVGYHEKAGGDQMVASREGVASVHPEMPLFHNIDVNLRYCLCDVLQYVSAQSIDFLDLVKIVYF